MMGDDSPRRFSFFMHNSTIVNYITLRLRFEQMINPKNHKTEKIL